MKNFFSVLESKKFEIIDVTLRDGGYLNQWSFNKEKLFKWVNFLTSLPISIIEHILKEYDKEISLYQEYLNILQENKKQIQNKIIEIENDLRNIRN
jgi:isopropylmalate/homocitrate/citramalate synthase